MRKQGIEAFMPDVAARPFAKAEITGDPAHGSIYGEAIFVPHMAGSLVIVELWGLPHDEAQCAENIFALHIHAGGECNDGSKEPFMAAGGHFDPGNCPHPSHAGDLPPVFGNRGYAWQAFYTERFTPAEVVGRTVILHGRRDDFTSQPAGDAGARIGCGAIRRVM